MPVFVVLAAEKKNTRAARVGKPPMGKLPRICGIGGMADALDLGSSDLGRKGSSPLSRTKRVRLTLNQNKPVSTATLRKVADLEVRGKETFLCMQSSYRMFIK